MFFAPILFFSGVLSSIFKYLRRKRAFLLKKVFKERKKKLSIFFFFCFQFPQSKNLGRISNQSKAEKGKAKKHKWNLLQMVGRECYESVDWDENVFD